MALVAVTCTLIGPVAGSAAAQAPVNNFAPEVVGSPVVGERIVCGAGSWSGSVSEFRYKWLRDAIQIAAGFPYKITPADAGHSLWCVVTAIGGGGSTEAESSNSLEIPGARSEGPTNTLPPEVSGTPAVGETLTCTPGAWTGNPQPTLTYRWVRDTGLPDETIIEPATASTYRVVNEDRGYSLACKVTATNGAGSASKISSNSLPVPGTKPEGMTAPRVLGIEPSVVGESLTCSPGTWSGRPAPALTYHWVRDRGLTGATFIESATGTTYSVEPIDQLHTLSCVVTATNGAGSAEAASSNSILVRGSKPENTTAPSVAGTPAVGATLTCQPGTWTGLPVPTYAYRWLRDQGSPQEVAIGSAASETYTVRIEDRGHSLSCAVTATNPEGSASRSSERVVVPAEVRGDSPPQNEVAPTVSGIAALGATLKCSQGTWSGNPTPNLTYEWLRDGSVIAAATASAYRVAEADQGRSLSCRVTAVNSEGLASQISGNVLEIPGVGPENLEAPRVSGVGAVGQQLTCLRGTWKGQPPPTFAYHWLRNGTSILAATASTYTVTSEDRGSSISCRVTAQNSVGIVDATSSNSLSVPGGQPQNTASPEISGTPAVGQQLTCSPGTWTGDPRPTYSYQWLLEGTEIPSASANAYTVTTAARGLELSCKVIASNREGTESAVSKSVHVPGLRPQVIEAPQVSGTAAVGAPLTCVRGTWGGAPPPAFTYRWLRDGASIASATSSTYTVELADKGHLLSCVVTAANREGRTEAESSNGVAVLRGSARTESAPELTFPPPASAFSQPSAAQVLAALHVQLARAQHRVRIASLRKTGLYAFPFAAPSAGTMEYLWYQASEETQRGVANAKPPQFAQSTTRFTGPSTRTVKLRLTSAGRRLISQSNRIKLTVRGVFRPPQGRPVVWRGAFLFSH